MKKMAIILTILGTFVLVIVGFRSKPKTTAASVPVTYNIGWQANQNDIFIDSFLVEILPGRSLNLMNSKSTVAYTVCGHINYEGSWQPKIEKVHISERLNRDSAVRYDRRFVNPDYMKGLDPATQYDRIIEITPVYKTKRNDKVHGGSEKFEFTNKHTIISGHWGKNRIKFVCGQHEQIIELIQKK